jgi:hypothetical protein
MKNVVAIEMIVVSSLVGGVVLEAEQQKLNEVKAKEKQLVEMSSNFKDYARRLAALAEDLMADRCTLVEAVAELSEARRRTGHDATSYLRGYYDIDDVTSCLAAQLCKRVAFLVADRPESERRHYHDRLACEFSQYQPRLPRLVEEIFALSE